MKHKSIVAALAVLLLVCSISYAVVVAAPATPGLELYVSPSGSDSNSGSISAPLATMAGARDRIRVLKAEDGLPAGGVTVYFRGGAYPVTDTVYFDARDSGAEGSPITYAAYPGETPVFTGGSYISGADFLPVADPHMLSRLAPEARGQVLCYNLYANGFSYEDLDYAKDFWQSGNLREHVAPHYHAFAYNVPRMQVFIDDDALYLARFPNKTSGTFAENPYNRYLMLAASEVIASNFDWGTETQTGGQDIFRTQIDRFQSWESFDDVIVAGMFGVEYAYDEILAQSIDPATNTVTLKSPAATGLLERGRYLFANVFEELDRPGEYYIDKASGMLYLYPTKRLETATVKLSRFDGHYMFSLTDTSYIHFSSLTAELTKGSVMRILGGSHCSVEDSTFKNFGMHGVHIGDNAISSFDFAERYGTPTFEEYLDLIPASVNGFHHSIRGCTFLNTGYTAATIASGNVGRREKGSMVFEGNTIMHSGLIGSCYQSGLTLNGCGITVKNNAFFFCRGQAISGNVVDTEILYNEFCDSPCEMAEDTGTIYLNYRTQNDGVKVRYNYFHDIPFIQSSGFGFPLRGGGAYFDNNAPFRDFCYNVVFNTPLTSIFVEHYFPAVSVGNIIIDVFHSVQEVPTEWLTEFYHGETGKEILEQDGYALGPPYNSGLYESDLWKQNYPELYEFYTYMLQKPDAYPLMSDLRDNVIVHLGRSYSHRAGILPPSMPVDPVYGQFANNHFLTADPGFANLEAFDFQLSPEAADRLGIEWIDMSKIGVPGLAKPTRNAAAYHDPWRWVAPTTDPLVQLQYDTGAGLLYGEHRRMVNFWRLAAPGIWEWEGDDALFPEGVGGMQMKAGATYTLYYPGCDLFPPQFLGGQDGETPPDGVLTFTVDPDRSRWDYYVFDLVPRGAQPADEYRLTVEGSFAADSGAGYYQAGESVLVSAGSREAYTFDGWELPDGLVLADPGAATTILTMPPMDVTITALWKEAEVLPDLPIIGVVTGSRQADVHFPLLNADGQGYSVYLSAYGAEGPFYRYDDVSYSVRGVKIKGLANAKEYFAYIEYVDSHGFLYRSRTLSFVPGVASPGI